MTSRRAFSVRPFVERLITIAKRGVSSGAANGKALNARRIVMQDLQDREVVAKLFDTIAPRFATRPGGYTRLLRIGFRKGDSAEVAQVELVGSEYDPRVKKEEGAKEAPAPKKSGVGGRLRAAAERLRGGNKPEGDAGGGKKATKPAKGTARRATTPRKAGGS